MNKIYDLEERTLLFAKNIRKYLRSIYNDELYKEDCKQLLRSSGSIGANYIEANESLGKKDFIMRLRISKKEAKETIFWLNALGLKDSTLDMLIKEATELMNILGAIIIKCQSKGF